jgi:glycine/D-amino acid oxidase-like deaminating enzyme
MAASKKDVIVIGGGLCGAAVAYYCALLGMQVTVLERATVGGGGATRHSRGIVRAYDPNPQLMRWGLEGAKAWRNWEIQGPSPFEACGIVYLLAPDNIASALDVVSQTNDPAYPLVILQNKELLERFPELRAADDPARPGQIAVYEPHGGYCDPRLAARIYGDAARRLGGSVLEGVDVRSVDCSDCSVRVTTQHAEIEATVAVVAGGANSIELVPSLEIFSRTIPLTCFENGESIVQCCVIDEVTGTYLRPEPPAHFYCGGAQQIDGRDPADLPNCDRSATDEHGARVPVLLRGVPGIPVGAITGCDAYTQNFLPLLGFKLADQPRLCLATGFSGRGAKYIPAIARDLSKTVCSFLRGHP